MTILPILKKFAISQLLLFYVFLITGIIVNILQFLTFLSIKPFNKKLYRKINYYLAYSLWSYLTAVGQYWSGTDVHLYISEEDAKFISNEHFICIMNHKYDIDWLMGWIICQRIGILGGSKILGKSSLKYLPVIGWCWVFTESLFIKRKWEEDSRTISKDFKEIIDDYPEDHFFNILIFCEGTRFTPQKHELSMKVARDKGLPELKHHLLPRTKGFTSLIKAANGRIPAIYDLNVAIDSSEKARAELNSIRDGIPLRSEVLVRRIPLDQIPYEDEAKCAQFVHKLYQEKDKIYDTFVQKGTYESLGYPRKPLLKNYYDLYFLIFWSIIILIPTFYYLTIFFTSSSLMGKFLIIIVSVLLYIGCKVFIRVTQIEHGSKYGLKDA